MERDLVGVQENWGKLCAYVEQWGVVENRATQWAALRAQQREEIAADLYDRMIPYNQVVVLFKRTSLHEMVNQYRLCRAVFVYIAAQGELHSVGPIREVIARYLVLYYSTVSGTFDVAHFAQNYKDANRF
ncbi:hypothetical protein K2Q00_03550 [Patescibacteria group bacterium]|nr:hypothetical protein [Patescibacteria group bacterium]